jgi:DNA-binding transcriptional ArsR family regulator
MKSQEDNVYFAIAHPYRREILQYLAHGDSNAMELPIDASPSVLSQHLNVLKKAKLVREYRQGRNRVYSLTPEPLAEPFEWLSKYEQFWNQHLHSLESYLEEKHGSKKDETD